MQITKEKDQELYISGRITAADAGEFKQGIMDLAGSKDLQLHMKDVSYISSAGLRVFIQLIHGGYSIHIKDVTQNVYEILEATGMPKVMTIDRPLRSVSIEGLEVIGTGASAKVYRLDDDRIIKVFYPSISLDFIKAEADRTRDAFLSGIDTMVTYDLVQTERGIGAVYEDLHSRDLIRVINEDRSRMPELIEGFGSFVRSMHEKILDRSKFGDRLDMLMEDLFRVNELGITVEEAQRLADVLDRAIPKSDHFIHGDCHIGNVMVRDDGSFQFIDMGRMSCGHIVYDLTSMFMQFRYQSYNHLTGRSSSVAKPFSEEERLTVWNTYLRAATGIEDEAVWKKAEEQINVIGGIIMLTSRRHRADLLTEEVCRPFVDHALAYATNGCEPLVF